MFLGGVFPHLESGILWLIIEPETTTAIRYSWPPTLDRHEAWNDHYREPASLHSLQKSILQSHGSIQFAPFLSCGLLRWTKFIPPQAARLWTLLPFGRSRSSRIEELEGRKRRAEGAALTSTMQGTY